MRYALCALFLLASAAAAAAMECGDGNVTLSNGLLMPRIGFGCAGHASAAQVETALRAGVRLLDTAQAREWYDEDAVVAGLAASGVARGAVVVVTKLHPRDHGSLTAALRIRESAAKFGGTVDVFLQHYPTCWDGLCGGSGWREEVEGDWRDSWRAMEAAYDAGLVGAIGVSNFGARDLDALLKFARVRPHVLQTWMDPFHSERALRKVCAREGVAFMAYSTLGTQWRRAANPVLRSETLRSIGKKYGAGPAAVAIAWASLRGAVVLPRSSSAAHIAANAGAPLCLSEADLAAVDALDGTLDGVPEDESAPALTAAFENLGDVAVDLFWVDPNGGDVKVAALAPRGEAAIETYAGHAFVARLPRSEAAVATFTVAAGVARQDFKVRGPGGVEL